jgi:2-methylcitrate dehydratase PrpD
VRERAFLESALRNPEIAALEDKVSLSVDPECAAKFPLHRSAKVEIEMADGTVFAHYQKTRHGDPDEPLSDQELLDKFYELAEPRIGQDQASALAKEILGDQAVSVRDLAQYWEKIGF